MCPMMVVFEVYLVPGSDSAGILSAETQRLTQAQIMTLEEARKLGFGGLREPPPDRIVRLIACAKRDVPWVHRALETNEAVGGFTVHDIG